MMWMSVSLLLLALVAVSWEHTIPTTQDSWTQQQEDDAHREQQDDPEDGGADFPSQEQDNNRLYHQMVQFAGAPSVDEQQQEDYEEEEVYIMNRDEMALEEHIGGVFYEEPNQNSMEDMLTEEMEQDEDGPQMNEENYHEVGEAGVVTQGVEWNNKLQKPLKVECQAGFGLYRIRSTFSKSAKDRRFLFTCNRVAPMCNSAKDYNAGARSCKWRKLNTIASNGKKSCPRNNYLAGIKSTATCKHDREWHGMCCQTPHVCMRSCKWTGNVNKLKKKIDYTPTGKAITGMRSEFNRNSMDRRYRFLVCSIVTC